jgi:hypothetical protein
MAPPDRKVTVIANTPAKAAVERVSNWVGHSDDVEADVRPQRQQSEIDDETRFSAADVWFPDGRRAIGLLKLTAGRVVAVDVFEGEVVWRLHRNLAKNTWWVDRHRSPAGVVLEDVGRFPLRYCSRLAYAGRPVLGIIHTGGAGAEWVIEGT